MYRKAMKKLTEWSKNKDRLPLVVIGAKGVGKTFILNDFAKKNYHTNLYFNFEHDHRITHLFSSDVECTIHNICSYYETEVVYEDTIIILDEIAFCQSVIDFLNNVPYYSDKLNIVCAVSSCSFLINADLKKVLESEKYNTICLTPLDFEEFLLATNNQWYCDAIREHYISVKPLPEIVHNNLLNLFNLYIYLGGMPDAINEYLLNNSLSNISEKHSIIKNNLLCDLQSKIGDGNYTKTQSVLNSIPTQLSKENKNFRYTLIRKGATKKMYEKNINMLCESGYALKCNNINPKDDNFKLYFYDIGVLNSMFNNLNDNEFNVGIIENYVMQNLLCNYDEVCYWESKAQAKVDFIIRKENRLTAIEVKNGTDTRSKNYSIFKEFYPDNEGLIKISAKNFIYSKGVKFIPLYAVFCI